MLSLLALCIPDAIRLYVIRNWTVLVLAAILFGATLGAFIGWVRGASCGLAVLGLAAASAHWGAALWADCRQF